MEQLLIEQQIDTPSIPDYLIRERISGIPFYYRDYRAVLNQQKTLEDIMGSSGLQAYVIATIIEFLNDQLNRKTYKILSNEVGLHLSKNQNLSSDIAIYEKTKLKDKLNNQYLEIAPKIALEVDVKIDESNGYDYVHLKTQQLLDFGVEKVVWIFTSSKKVMVADSKNDWLTKDWNKTIEILGVSFSVEQILEEEGLL